MVINARNYVRLTADKISYDGCINLIEAFLRYLGEDFRSAYHTLRASPKDKGAIKHYKQYTDFIKSEYFRMLTGLDGESLLDSLERDAAKYDI